MGSSHMRGACATSGPRAELVGEEDGVEQPRLGPLREVCVVADVGERERRGRRVAPGGFVMAAGMDEQVEVQPPRHGVHQPPSSGADSGTPGTRMPAGRPAPWRPARRA